ncbi:tRNA (5-methylaminomethyl-2-thiouridine)(34)-methyltransferase MnmD [Salinimicrobium catena]|uniref:tRNA (5-methylaminomethyl-2-thiouridine)(34)-methyltransferase MnmD n=1 Tax=Salinimicrobium catena TaxID=390640 RepID=UPI002FE48073
MKREIIKTGDGSATIYLPEWNEHYHSKHGALQEAQHVFIESGLRHYLEKKAPARLNILEIGFGTGLNALLSYYEAQKGEVILDYTGVEAYPVSVEELESLDYARLFPEDDAAEVFAKLHQSPWGRKTEISPLFCLQKQQMFFKDIKAQDYFDLIFFDAFGPRVQPELWTEEIFMRMYNSLRQDGVLVTYSAKGSVRRAMQAVGFLVERLPGPPGKREMLRATKKGER